MHQSIPNETTHCQPCDKTLKTPLGYLCHMQTARVHIDERKAMAREERLVFELALREISKCIRELRQMVSEMRVPDHAPGLCESTSCPDCEESRILLGRRVHAAYMSDLRAAAEFYGLNEDVDWLAEAHAKWVSEGRPIAATPEPHTFLPLDRVDLAQKLTSPEGDRAPPVEMP